MRERGPRKRAVVKPQSQIQGPVLSSKWMNWVVVIISHAVNKMPGVLLRDEIVTRTVLFNFHPL